jgi:hypothetical protein
MTPPSVAATAEAKGALDAQRFCRRGPLLAAIESVLAYLGLDGPARPEPARAGKRGEDD